MTPEEAVNKLPYTKQSKRLALFEAVKSTAKADETRRCAAEVRSYARLRAGYCAEDLARHLLATGGLEAES